MLADLITLVGGPRQRWCDAHDHHLDPDPTPAPIIILVGPTGIADTVMGLRMGADDYVVQPSAAPELVARMQAILRRARLGPARETRLAIYRQPWALPSLRAFSTDADSMRIHLGCGETQALPTVAQLRADDCQIAVKPQVDACKQRPWLDLS